MYTLLVLAFNLALGLCVNGEAPACPDQKTKDLLQKYKFKGEITPLLKGHTYVDFWRRVGTAELLDCAMTKFTADGNGFTVKSHNVEHDGSPIIVTFKATENKGQSSLTFRGELHDGDEKLSVNEYVHVFYADHNAFGFFGCDVVKKTVRIVISVRKDKEKDAEALKSVKKAQDIMDKLKGLIHEEMTELKREKCPKEI